MRFLENERGLRPKYPPPELILCITGNHHAININTGVCCRCGKRFWDERKPYKKGRL